MDNLLFDIRSPDKIVKRAMVIPRRRLSSLLLGYAWKSRSGSCGIPARFAVESALALLWNQRSVWRGIRSETAEIFGNVNWRLGQTHVEPCARPGMMVNDMQTAGRSAHDLYRLVLGERTPALRRQRKKARSFASTWTYPIAPCVGR